MSRVRLQTIVTLIGSDDYRFVVVGDFGVVSSYNPRTILGDVQTVVYVRCTNTSKKELFV